MWKEKNVAPKEYDCARTGVSERFKAEVKAYEMLKEAQGLLVPETYFASELPGYTMKYLGLQLGRGLTSANDFD